MEPTRHSSSSQRVDARLLRSVCAHWYQVVSIPAAEDVSSARVGTRNENSNDTSPKRKSYHACVLVLNVKTQHSSRTRFMLVPVS